MRRCFVVRWLPFTRSTRKYIQVSFDFLGFANAQRAHASHSIVIVYCVLLRHFVGEKKVHYQIDSYRVACELIDGHCDQWPMTNDYIPGCSMILHPGRPMTKTASDLRPQTSNHITQTQTSQRLFHISCLYKSREIVQTTGKNQRQRAFSKLLIPRS